MAGPTEVRKEHLNKIGHEKKIERVRRLRYMCPGAVHSLTSFFAVPKGEQNIRMVYDEMKSGLNDSLWAPWFALPTIEGHL